MQNSVQLTLKYGLSSRFVLMAAVPYTFNRISSEGGTETADGLGDPEIMAMAHLLSFASGAWQLQGVAGGRVPLGNSAQKALFNPVDVIAEVNGRTADYDDAAGETDANSGGAVVYFSPGLRLRLGGALSLRGQVQIPVVEDLHREQNEKVNVRTGLVWAL